MDMALPPLPDDIMRKNILTRLEVKSLVRFRSVCKLWNSLISDTEFINDHLHCTTQNPKDDNLIFTKSVYDDIDHSVGWRVEFGDISVLSFSELSETRMSHVPDLELSRYDMDMLGSINGLVCLFHYKLNQFLLWNPATRHAMKINSPIRRFNLRDVTLAFLGFCWDALENDFKLVHSYYDKTTGNLISSPLILYIYSCNLGSWSLVPNFMFSGGRRLDHAPSVIVNGMPYWNYYAINKKDPFMIEFDKEKNPLMIKFDVGNKEFRSLPELEVASEHDFIIVNLKECLSVLVYKVQSSNSLVDVHYFDEKFGVWSKMYNTVGPIFGHVFCCFKNGGEIVFIANGIYRCYDHKTNKIMDLDNQEGWIRECFSYTESLIFLQGMKPQHQVETGLWKQHHSHLTKKTLAL